MQQSHTLVFVDGTERRPSPTAIVNWLNEPHRRRLGSNDAAAALRLIRNRAVRGDKKQTKDALDRLWNSKRICAEHYWTLREYC